jgi:hypothetical protein
MKPIKFSTSSTVTGSYIIGYVRWVGATTAGHTATLRDPAGNEWFRSEADGANFIDLFPLNCRIQGGLVLSMGSGVFYAYPR